MSWSIKEVLVGLWDAVTDNNVKSKTYPDNRETYQDYTKTPENITPVKKEK